MMLLVLLVALLGLSLASALGWTVDSRDDRFSLGRVFAPREAFTRDR